VVDPFVRKGYRFMGRAAIREPGSAEFAEGIERLRAGGSKLTGRVKAIVVIEVYHAKPLISPVYDDQTTTEADVLEQDCLVLQVLLDDAVQHGDQRGALRV
jgi:hypothetical protein